MIAAMGDDNLLTLLIGKKVNAQHFAAGANLTLYVGRDVAGFPFVFHRTQALQGLGLFLGRLGRCLGGGTG